MQAVVMEWLLSSKDTIIVKKGSLKTVYIEMELKLRKYTEDTAGLTA